MTHIVHDEEDICFHYIFNHNKDLNYKSEYFLQKNGIKIKSRYYWREINPEMREGGKYFKVCGGKFRLYPDYIGFVDQASKLIKIRL